MPDARNRCVCTIYSKSYSVTMDYKAKREFWYFNKMQFPSFPAILLPFFFVILVRFTHWVRQFFAVVAAVAVVVGTIVQDEKNRNQFALYGTDFRTHCNFHKRLFSNFVQEKILSRC